jgi:hypothetical protein
MKNTADVTDGTPIAVLLQSISGVSAINPLVAFYDIHGGKREVLYFCFVSDTTRDKIAINITNKPKTYCERNGHWRSVVQSKIIPLNTWSDWLVRLYTTKIFLW